MGNTIAICTDCLKEIQSAVDGYVEEKKAIVKTDKPLFPHPELDVTLSSVIEKEPEPVEVIDAVTEDNQISVAEDTVTPIEEPTITTTTPKKKPNKKK